MKLMIRKASVEDVEAMGITFLQSDCMRNMVLHTGQRSIWGWAISA